MDEKKPGYYLVKHLKEAGYTSIDIHDMFQYALDHPEYTGPNNEFKGFRLNRSAVKVFNYYAEKYLYLNNKSSLKRDAVVFNKEIEKSIVKSLRILLEGQEDHLEVIEAFQQNLAVEKKVLHIKDDKIFKDGPWYKVLKVAFKKQF